MVTRVRPWKTRSRCSWKRADCLGTARPGAHRCRGCHRTGAAAWWPSWRRRRDAGDVVGGVAAEGLVVDDLLRSRQAAVTLPHLRLAVDDVLSARTLHQHAHAGAHQLQRVRVAGDDDRVHALLSRLGGERPEEVVRLELVQLHDRDAHGLHEPADMGELVAQLRVHLRPGGLVLAVELVAERGHGPVKGEDEVRGAQIVYSAQEHLREAVDAAHLLAGAADGERPVNGEKRPVDHRVAVEQHQERCVLHAECRLLLAGHGAPQPLMMGPLYSLAAIPPVTRRPARAPRSAVPPSPPSRCRRP